MRYIIFGGSGSFGTAMTKRLLETTDAKIRIFDRNEKLQFEHKQKFNNPRIEYVIGDIRDYKAVYNALEDVDYVFLASAMKHIDKCEANPNECKKTNIDGCINVINASIEREIKKLIFLSTDKATSATTIYGASKLFVELYCQAVDNKKTDIIRTRYGNVFGSNGSVAWIFDKLSKEGKTLTVTNPDMTRFFMKLDEAIDLVLFALENGTNGDLFVYNNKACTIQELANLFSDKQEVVGQRCLEKTDEALLTVQELNHSMLYDNKYFRVNLKDIPLDDFYKEPLTSDNCGRLSQEELNDLLKTWREYNGL
jgi:UDP-glucose 4-epimerase